MKNLLSYSPTLPTQSMDGTLDQQYMIIYAKPDITLILGGGTKLYTIAFFPVFIRIPNYSSRDMAIHVAADLAKALQKPKPESPFQVGESQLKSIRELANIFDAETKIPNRDTLPTPPALPTKNITKVPRVEDQMAPPPRVDPYDEYKYREQKLPSPIQTTPPSAATRGEYTKKLKGNIELTPPWPLHRKQIWPTASNAPVQYQSEGNKSGANSIAR